jgi:flavin-dependent dehydrogenase
LSRFGRKVILLEKAHHPRFHIGESLLPMNLPLFERLGVLDKVRAMGVFKPGADFEADNERGYNTFAFRRAIGNSPPHAYQVWRQDFDKMLFDHARASGADAREGHEAVAFEQVDSRCSRVDVSTDAGQSYRITARYVVDATGRDTLLSVKKRLRRKNTEHQSAAIFGHFRGAERRPGEDAGNISIYFLLETLRRNDGVKSRMVHAELIDGEVRVTGNYSYDSTQMGGAGWVMIGDAFAFLDPVFSSGVYLAMSGAEQAATVVDEALREPAREAALLRKLERRQRAGMKRFAFFIYRFNSPIMGRIFRQPRNIWQIEQGVISMLAGDLFDSPKVIRRLAGFKLVYALTALRNFTPWRSEHRYRLEQARAQFTGGTTPLDRM